MNPKATVYEKIFIEPLRLYAAAQLVGVSFQTLMQWIYMARIEAMNTAVSIEIGG
jgi:hypothetical protein